MKPRSLALALCLAALLTACGPLTQENYNKLKVGMSFEDVTRIIGKPANCTEVLGVKSCRWGDEKQFISVNFVGDAAVVFSSQNLR